MAENKILDLGETFFDHEFLVEMEDPEAADYPNGMTIHVLQCADCGAHTNDGDPNHIEHFNTCKPGEADYWADFYQQENQNEPTN